MRDREGIVNVAAVVAEGAESTERTGRKLDLYIAPRQPQKTALHAPAHPQQFSLRHYCAEPEFFASRGRGREHLGKFAVR